MEILDYHTSICVVNLALPGYWIMILNAPNITFLFPEITLSWRIERILRTKLKIISLAFCFQKFDSHLCIGCCFFRLFLRRGILVPLQENARDSKEENLTCLSPSLVILTFVDFRHFAFKLLMNNKKVTLDHK